MTADLEQPPARRVADLWTSLILLVLAAAMIGGALQFPLRGTYAGVRNAWYVSPALFPLIVAGSLAILALVLLAGALRSGAATAAFGRSEAKPGGMDVLLIAGLIVAFVFAFVPRIDFVVAAAFFLFAFTTVFHGGSRASSRIVLLVYFGSALGVVAMALLGWTPAPRSTEAFLVDGVLLGTLAVVMLATWFQTRGNSEDRRKLRQCIGVSVLTPFILTAVFKFFLLVPLPREGVIVVALDTLRYALRAAG